MERRTFLNSLLGHSAPEAPLAKTNAFANTVLPKRAAESEAGLETYTGPWGFEEAAHLLRRTLFGVRQGDIERAVSLGMKATVEALLGAGNSQTAPTHDYDHDVIKLFWMKNMVRDDFSIQEKMTLFWHNHFVIEADQMPYTQVISTYYDLLRKNHLGNLRDFTKAVTVHPSMLRYLNGDNSKKASPNDNCARELQELFTIGVEQGNWHHNNKTFGLQRLTLKNTAKPVFEFQTVRSKGPTTMELEFTQPLKSESGVPANFPVSQWSYIPNAGYGGGRGRSQTLSVKSAQVAADGKKVLLEIEGMKTGMVVYFRLPGLRSQAGDSLWSTEAW